MARQVYELIFLGEVQATKNEKMPVRRRTGKLGLITKPEVSLAMDRLALQIPGYMRDLRLEHPDLDVYFDVCRDTIDRDNIASSLIDLCWRYGVIVDDDVKHFNGVVTLHPARMASQWKTKLRFRENPPAVVGLTVAGRSSGSARRRAS